MKKFDYFVGKRFKKLHIFCR